MINTISKRWRTMVLISALLGLMMGAVGTLFVSHAQGDGYFCPPQYQTCSSDWGYGQFGDVPGEGGGFTPCSGGGTWTCPVAEVSTEDQTGAHTCTSTGCRKYQPNAPNSNWVCAFTASGQGTTCPPLMECSCD